MNIAALVALFGVATPATLESPRIEQTGVDGDYAVITLDHPGPAGTEITMVNTGVTDVSAGGQTQEVLVPLPAPGKVTYTYAHLEYGEITADSNEIQISNIA